MKYQFQLKESIANKSFLITGGAGFIGSNLVEFLLANKAGKVRVLDNLSTGYLSNIKEFMENAAFEFIEGDITNIDDCLTATKGINIVLHQAALGSVPRSIKNPAATNATNVSGFVNILFAAKENNVKRFVYASSSSVYGDDKTMPKKEDITGSLLSPYAVSKKANELYADVFSKTYGMEIIGLRYFNVFGPKQNINGPYAAVIPIFITKLLNNEAPTIFGTGETTRDFTFIENVIQANLLAALTTNTESLNKVYNVAFGATTSLNTLYNFIAKELNSSILPHYGDERKGDIKDSFADINNAKTRLDYEPKVGIEQGLKITVDWYLQSVKTGAIGTR